MSSTPATKGIGRIGVVTCSTRSTRVNPLVTDYICSLLHKALESTGTGATATATTTTTLDVIDLEAQRLPLYDEPAVPAKLPADDPTPHYRHEHTRRWSAVARAHDAFVFVTPQYNWSVPASLKNALDYLYHEWAGKPAAVVSYGGRGGGKAAAHLQQILAGLRMRVAATAVPLVISARDVGECLAAGRLSDEVVERWEGDGEAERLLGIALGEMMGSTTGSQ